MATMSTSCVTEIKSCINYKCKTPSQLSNLHSCETLNDSKMAPLVEQEKNNGNDVLAAEHPDDHYTSTETNSSENNSDVHPDDEDSINKLRNLPLNDNSPNVNGSLSNDHRSLSQLPLDYVCSIKFPRRNARTINGMNKLADSSVNGNDKLVFDGFYRCHKCDFVGRNDDELHEHALRHDPYECGSCGFLADSQDSLQMHLRDDHSDIPVSLWDDHILFHETTVESSPKKTSKVKPFEENIDKPRKTPCKICNNFTGNSKMEYYAHLRDVHSETGKLLHCDLCPFIALYKHHLEYHFRNHYGSKPYKCDRCDYSCVNRSMLNSHYKSHSDVYQYSCKNCSYMTKYLHSLKMHLRKYNHQPGRVLNPDGSVNSNTIIDVHGKRRGPKSKKRKSDTDLVPEGRESPKSKSSPSPPSSSFNPHPSQNIRIMYNPHIYNNYTGNLYIRSGALEATNYMLHSPPNIGRYPFRCAYCEFVADSFEMYHYHMCSHVNQDQSGNGGLKNFPFIGPPPSLNSLDFGTHFNTEPFSRNIMNQSTVVDRKNAGESRNKDATDKDTHFQNFKSTVNSFESPENSIVNPKESSLNRRAIRRPVSPFNDQQLPKRRYQKRRENRIKSNTPSPNATLTVKEEIFEAMNGSESPFANNPTDSIPLDLSVKQMISPETKSNETSSYRFQLPGGKAMTTLGRSSSASPQFGNGESKAIAQKTNRRKGKAFKLNQYTIESDPVSDGIENELEKMSVLYESYYSNEAQGKPTFGAEIKKSVPRINFKPTLSTAKWDGHNFLESRQSEYEFVPQKPPPPLTPPKLELVYKEPKQAAQQANGRRAWERSNDSWCSSCCIDTGNAFLLQLHSSYHTEGDPFTCAKCGLRCDDKVRFNSHIISGSRINGNCINAIEECES
ncbi:uncharacterized protein LOC129981541 [Argiope bruennichi]|uniref:uncharacterized protein LOC129981541 n=1 Tax=Argiope bruennichi TaxID=94029 RepID=UPI0024948437|nr:uncharacterized protein LOC129981541 [Argiope bruennichi]XP_055948388.1 uncharacterized protein LOC129981541 [Argiope bruennichi]